MFKRPNPSAWLRVSTTALILTSIAPALADPPASVRPPQYVLISFDGAHEIAQWKRSHALARRTGARFTYFLSCVFLLSPETKTHYRPPGKKPGASNVGFARSRDEVAERLYQIRLAAAQGNEIASHGCGHFDGGAWTGADWAQEFAAFSDVMRNAYTINGLGETPGDWAAIANSVKGFRAPYLSTSAGLYTTLAADGFAYDASGVSTGPVTPERRQIGPVRFALPQIKEGPNERRVIAMDYNLFVRHSRGVEVADTDRIYETRALDAFQAAFDSQYSGQRIPLQLGFHFSLMNGAAYWRALERFAQDNCGKPQVACVTYSDYLQRTGGQHAGG